MAKLARVKTRRHKGYPAIGPQALRLGQAEGSGAPSAAHLAEGPERSRRWARAHLLARRARCKKAWRSNDLTPPNLAPFILPGATSFHCQAEEEAKRVKQNVRVTFFQPARTAITRSDIIKVRFQFFTNRSSNSASQASNLL
jgi:hypothetical protein